jgi:hypothetical protein
MRNRFLLGLNSFVLLVILGLLWSAFRPAAG